MWYQTIYLAPVYWILNTPEICNRYNLPSGWKERMEWKFYFIGFIEILRQRSSSLTRSKTLSMYMKASTFFNIFPSYPLSISAPSTINNVACYWVHLGFCFNLLTTLAHPNTSNITSFFYKIPTLSFVGGKIVISFQSICDHSSNPSLPYIL